jgi:hypothetical protein
VTIDSHTIYNKIRKKLSSLLLECDSVIVENKLHVEAMMISALYRDHRGCDRMVVRFTTTCAISAYHH